MQTYLKKVSREAVCFAATRLILAEGCATALYVTMMLDQQGYSTRQSDVSALLFQVAEQEGWQVEDNGFFRVYYFPTYRPSLT